jgi:hypothetical protein
MDYLPTSEVDKIIWGTQFVRQAKTNALRWNLPQGDVDDLEIKHKEFERLYRIANSPQRTIIVTQDKNAALKAFVSKLREIVRFLRQNPNVTDMDQYYLGIAKKTPVKPRRPNQIPYLYIKPVSRMVFSLKAMHSGRKLRPTGVAGALIAWGALSAEPKSPEQLPNKQLVKRSPKQLLFSEEEKGKTLYAAACWQNTCGECGPWSRISSVYIQ